MTDTTPDESPILASKSSALSKGVPLLKAVFLSTGVVEVTAEGVSRTISLDSWNKFSRGIREEDVKEVVKKGTILHYPRGTFRVETLPNRELIILTYHPGQVATIKYSLGSDRGVVSLKVALPNMVVAFKFKPVAGSVSDKYAVHGVRYWTCPGSPTFLLDTSSENIYNGRAAFLLPSPLPNTYEEGRMCYGKNDMPSYFEGGNFTAADWYYDFLTETPFNSDLSLQGIAGSTLEEWPISRIAGYESEGSPYSMVRKVYGSGGFSSTLRLLVIAAYYEKFPYKLFRGFKESAFGIPGLGDGVLYTEYSTNNSVTAGATVTPRSSQNQVDDVHVPGDETEDENIDVGDPL